MPEIVLTTLNAKYIHAAFGLRCLMANLGPLRPQAAILEFDINQRPAEIAEALLAAQPRIVGLGIYIWNVTPATEVAAILKRVRPDLILVLGGPEVSYETDPQPIARWADYIISGEGDLEFRELCSRLVEGVRPPDQLVTAEPPAFSKLALPYELYDERDINHRVLYVEASRGCPYQCEFCLSSLDIPVRQAPLDAFLEQMGNLLDRGARQLKFVDRTFNLDLATSRRILEFLLGRWQPGHFFHFEMVPDRLPEALREVIARFPAGALQFEVGIQTFNPEAAARIQRRQNYARLEDNLRFLREKTGVHVHADLIAGLPGEDFESFAAGFDRLIALGPHEIQVGILKRLRGTTIGRHDAEWEVVYNPNPPYDLLRNRLLDFATMRRLHRFARYWDLVGNSGNFIETRALIWSGEERSPFRAFLRWSEWLRDRAGRTDSIALTRLMQWLFEFLTGELRLAPGAVAGRMWRDYQRGGRPDVPEFLREWVGTKPPRPERGKAAALPKRQARAAAGPSSLPSDAAADVGRG